MIAGFDTQRIQIGDQVSTNAISIDELDDSYFLGGFRPLRCQSGNNGLAVGRPAYRLMRHLQMREHFFVEVLTALEQLLNLAEEHARLRALNNAMVVSAAHGHHLADPERC